MTAEAGANRIEEQVKTRDLHGLRRAVANGVKATAARAWKTAAKHHALFKRLRDRREDYLHCVHGLTLCRSTTTRPSSDRNGQAADQGLPVPAHPARGPGLRKRAQDFAAIRTSLATAARQDQPMLDVLVQAMRGSPWMPTTA